MKLNEKEAVHCRTQEEFDKVAKIIDSKYSYNLWEIHKENSCISCHDGSFTYCSLEHYEYFGYKILSYSDFMGEEWKPKNGEWFWTLDECLKICEHRMDNRQHSLNKIKSGYYFRTRQLARDTKKEIQEVLKKARKG